MMSCFQAVSPTYSANPSTGVYLSSYHTPHPHIPSTSPAPPASPRNSIWPKTEVESSFQRWCMNADPDDVSASQRFVPSSALTSATTKRPNRSPDGATSSSLPSYDHDQTPARAEYLGKNCVLLTYFSGDISSHVDGHFSRALAHLHQHQHQHQHQQQKVTKLTSSASDAHQSNNSLSGSLAAKDCNTSSHWKASCQTPSPSTAYYASPNMISILPTPIVDVGVPHENVISSFDDWRYSFGATFTNGAYDHGRIRDFGRSQTSPLITNPFNVALNFPNGADRRQSAVNARWTPYEKWRRMERTADDAPSFSDCDRSLSMSSVGGLTRSCQLQLPSAAKQSHTSDLYWF